MPSLTQVWLLPGAVILIVCLAANWVERVSGLVPEPYLDEFFHVPQAQKYCKGDYSWDPKITTPPGLYLISKLFKPLLGCETRALRIQNAVALCAILALSYLIRRILRFRASPGKPLHESRDVSKKGSSVEDPTFVDIHTAINICLFSPLFFFSGLYYTDVMSTLAVLLAYTAHLASSQSPSSFIHGVSVLVSGIFALFFRQTNIFWVAVFPAGLAVVNALKADAPSTTSSTRDIAQVLQDSWATGRIVDLPIQHAELQDVIIFLASLIVAALRKPLLVLRVAVPYVIILALFAGFVVWNGSVVLGDKSAHTATIHVPQMLYIWPYFALFSIPLLIEPLLSLFVPLLPKRAQVTCNEVFSASTYGRPSLLASGLFMTGAILAVHFNTIIHPYTLADNRHYVFYVFKLLRLYPVLRYLAVPVYFVCAWLVVRALATPTAPSPNPTGRDPCQVSFVVIWLAATTLSVVTAPLVEPRYFILPWVIWRLHVPTSSTRKASFDVRMIVETIWLLTINLAVAYMFLYRTFTWTNEPGKLQRFIW
ncbi:glucosyltransferase [Exserohilum turcicum]